MHKSVTVTAASVSGSPVWLHYSVKPWLDYCDCASSLWCCCHSKWLISNIGTRSATLQLAVIFKSTLVHFALVCCLFIAHSAIWWPACRCKKCNFSPRHKEVSVLFWAVGGCKSLPAVGADDGLLLLQHGQKHPLCLSAIFMQPKLTAYCAGLS